MRRQFLGDVRDAFKWDLLHWLCTTSQFSRLIFVPMLTPDRPDSNDGQIKPSRFKCRPFIRPFLESLKVEPRTLQRIEKLGSILVEKPFDVFVYAPDTYIGSKEDRLRYWRDLNVEAFENSIVFFDPDNGYEIKSRRGDLWIQHDELRDIFSRLPKSSAAVVYQHRPFFQRWGDVFANLAVKMRYVQTAAAAYDSSLAFVGMAQDAAIGIELGRAMRAYADGHDDVEFRLLAQVDAQALTELESSRQTAALGFQMLDEMEAQDETDR